jgi:hypothetical protein
VWTATARWVTTGEASDADAPQAKAKASGKKNFHWVMRWVTWQSQ